MDSPLAPDGKARKAIPITNIKKLPLFIFPSPSISFYHIR
jgi:hypothetical protein